MDNGEARIRRDLGVVDTRRIGGGHRGRSCSRRRADHLEGTSYRARVSRIAGDTDDENLKLPAVSDRLGHSRWAIIALVLLVLGFGLQAIGALLSAAG